ncbi:hypothetical protein LZC95_04640 [Pendulispora brunnea]|uniref:Uncharacterized protein n=1 Tax=Pendulispora brunnea TaxID=2905690 RepID=A0ABZ2KGB1_9BACT
MMPWEASLRIIGAHASVSPGETQSEQGSDPLAVDRVLPVAREVLAQASIEASSLDLILSMSISPDRVALGKNVAGPRVCHPLQRDLGAERAFVFDLYDDDWSAAIDIARGFCHEMDYKHVLLVRVECGGRSLAKDPESGFRIPDGAGCLLLRWGGGKSEPFGGWSHTNVAPIQVDAFPWAECASGELRGQYRFPLQQGVSEKLNQAAIGLLRNALADQKADHVVIESWFPGDVDARAVKDAVGLDPAIDTRLGPFGLPYFAETLRGDGTRRLLSLTLNPFQMRYGYQWLQA